jgi:hypothetical protein
MYSIKPKVFKFYYNNNSYYGYGYDNEILKTCLCTKLNIEKSDLPYVNPIVIYSQYQIDSVNKNYVDYANLCKSLKIDSFKRLRKMSLQEIMVETKISYDLLCIRLCEYLNVPIDVIKSYDLSTQIEIIGKNTLNRIFIKTVKLQKVFNFETKEEDIFFSSRIDEWKILIKKLLSRDPTIFPDYLSLDEQINNLSGFVNKLDPRIYSKEFINSLDVTNVKLEQDIKSLSELEKVKYLKKLNEIKSLYENRLNNTYYFVNAEGKYLFKDFSEFKEELDKIYNKLVNKLSKSYYKDVMYDENLTLQEALYSYEAVGLNDYKI